MTLGQRLARLRTQQGISQETMAERLGVTRQSVSKWETDASIPELDKLVRYSELFGVTLDELVKGPEARTSESRCRAETPPSLSGWSRRLPWQSAAHWVLRNVHLLGWGLTAWGLWGFFHSAWQALTVLLPVMGVGSALEMFFLTMLPKRLLELLRMFLGAVIVLRGRRTPCRREHLGWIPLLAGLLGFPLIPELYAGVLQPLFFFPMICLTQSPEEVAAYLVTSLQEYNGSLLLCLIGAGMLLAGHGSSRKPSPAHNASPASPEETPPSGSESMDSPS